MWPLVFLFLLTECALNTEGQAGPDVSDGADGDGDSIMPDILDAVDEVYEVLPEFTVETADADADDVYISDGSDEGEASDPCFGNLAPRSFHLLSPAPGETGVSTRTIFEWGPSIDPEGDPVEYSLTYDDADPLTLPIVIPLIETNRYELSAAEAVPFGADFTWSVSAFDQPCRHETVGISSRTFTTREYPICSKVGSDVRITNEPGDSIWPSPVWVGTDYGVAWQDHRDGNDEIYFTRLSGVGEKIGLDVRVTNVSGDSMRPSLVLAGSEYGAAWQDGRDGNNEIYFARLSASGEKIGSDVRVTNAAGDSMLPSLVWAGTEYGVAWYDGRNGNNEIYFGRLSAIGEKIGSDVRITNAMGDSTLPSLAWTGSEYGVAWQDGRDGNNEIYFAHLSSAGVKVGSDSRITTASGHSLGASLAWTGTEYGAAWFDNRDSNYEIYFGRISAVGALISSDIRLTDDVNDSRYPSLFWNGLEYAVAWHDNRDSNYEIYFGDFSETGDGLGSDIRITDDGGTSECPRVVWTGSEYGITLWDDRDGNNEIYFTRAICEP